ncbi:hypothetical protein EGH24_03585 [Halonotius terrestris]|uniref:Uncharacterized protein n=1 Tax=Halonotius terrestris TaxID=2487750 RepID=A0A8J8TCM2_9EURY|nr:hypothetical protein [Halonotius terrestris]TQQ82548.1 hypothetical protein EGH24_03585 [Halonotius terrestris]
MPSETVPDRSGADGTDALARLFKSGRTNAVISWLLVGILAVVFVESILDIDLLWTLFVTATAAIVLLPPVTYRDWRMMLPWELLVIALAPILVRALFGGELGTFGSYLSLAALALLVTVELHMFTDLQLTHWFAVLLVVLTTMASVAAWSAVRWLFDQRFGTEFLLQPGVSQDAANAALMEEWLWVTLAGLVAGVLFDAYFRGRGRTLRRRLRQVVRR